MYLIDTNVVSELRKGRRANRGVRAFFRQVVAAGARVYLSVVTVGELRRGVERIRHRGDRSQARDLDAWLGTVLQEHENAILPLDRDAADIWGRLRAPHPENALDKQIAAIALMHDLTVVTRNTRDFATTGVHALNPFVEPE